MLVEGTFKEEEIRQILLEELKRRGIATRGIRLEAQPTGGAGQIFQMFNGPPQSYVVSAKFQMEMPTKE